MHEGVLIRPRPVPRARFRIFLLHHAGGSSLGYRPWVRHFPADWEVCLVEAPGRGRSSADKPFRDAGELARHLRAHLAPELDPPFGFFGHSMGALLAYELTALLAADGPAAPAWLGVSAWSPAPGPERDEPRHLLPSEQLRRSIARMGGTAAGSPSDPEQWKLVEPLIRADLELVDTWRPDPGAPPLRTPLSAFGGRDDPGVTPERLAAWDGCASGPVERHILPGEHFYFVGRIGDVVTRIVKDVQAALPREV
ncbi:thioesterase II family protein [Nocardiopsis alborubida]|uniref:Thioesterase n=1 Tax=Nocardiopsis alborubida TaxID=146802 RepID=A0A7X6MI70_9ACTN|nr:thioesterase domain-containing protein [Nocardiopsis alborubida]NKZ01208.1 thioesterase [Nocardiopsis alborubida]